MNNTTEVWYDYHGVYNGINPPLYDLNGITWYDKLKHDLPDIREKVLAFLKLDGLDIKEHFDKDKVEGNGWWGGVSFMFWGVRYEKAIAKGRDVFKCFSDIPGIVQLTVSILKPNTHIKPHSGDTDAIYRLHIPIYIPAQLPACGFTVGGITRPWKENDMIVFCDAYFHEAWNLTDEPRIIIILDVIKEEFLPQTNKICATVLASMRFQFFASKLRFLKKIVEWAPKWMKNFARKILGSF